MESWGICFGPAWGSSIAELIDAGRRAERRGFDRIAVGEYHNDALTWLHALAGATRSIRVATTIVNIALRHPAVTAEAVAGIRDLHGDRIDLGLGISHARIVRDQLGSELPNLGDLAEYVEAVRAALAGRSFTGRRWSVTPEVRRTRTCAGPVPIVAAALGRDAAGRAAAYADGLVLTWTPHRQIAAIAEIARAAARDAGRPAPALWVVLPCLPADSYEQSLLAAAVHLRGYLDLPSYRRMLNEAGFAAEVDRAREVAPDDARGLVASLGESILDEVALIAGGHDARAALDRTVRRLHDLGVDELILYPLSTSPDWRAALDRTIEELAPSNDQAVVPDDRPGDAMRP